MMKQLKIWIECARLRTLPVSVSGVVLSIIITWWLGQAKWVPAVLCVVFAVLAQVVSNFANEYFDYRHGFDKVGRVGPRRGVTEGDITPSTLRNVTIATLVVDVLVGLCLIHYGGWWMLPLGIVITLAAIAYSAGPYPLSTHGLGEVAVFIFFGLVPVVFTHYVQTLRFHPLLLLAGMAVGFMAVNVLLVNNYRDVDDDRQAGKRTSVVIFGRKPAAAAYLINGYVAMSLLTPIWLLGIVGQDGLRLTLVAPAVYLVLHTIAWYRLTRSDGAALNPLLGATARNMLIFTLLLAIALVITRL